MGAASQWALTMRTAVGVGSDCDHRNSSSIHTRVVEDRRGPVAQEEGGHGAVVRRPQRVAEGRGCGVAEEGVE